MNTNRHISLVVLLTLALTAFSATAQQRIIADISNTPMPNATLYLPAPPDSLSLAFSVDVYQYMLGKTLRNTPRGEQARNDVPYGTEMMITRMAPIIGLEINPENTPNIYQLFTSAISAIGNTCNGPKSYYKRRRPFDRFGEIPFTPERPASLMEQGSYPSAHSMLGWGSALVLSQLAPQYADRLLASGWEYGQSRSIVGVHWQSDIDASRMMSAASIARLVANPAYLEQLRLAREEYDRLTGNTRSAALNARVPLLEFAPTPPDSTSAAFANDLSSFFVKKALRTGERGSKAATHADVSPEGLCTIFSPIVKLSLNTEKTPEIYYLLQLAVDALTRQITQYKTDNPRLRPLARFTGETLITRENRDSLLATSSFPSHHAAAGWLAALLMMDVAPEFQNAILLEGREIGESRVIAGVNYRSDVDAGQLLAGVMHTMLTNDPDFMTQLTRAQDEYVQALALAPVISDNSGTVPLYTIDGRPATPDTRGIVVGNNTKILRP